MTVADYGVFPPWEARCGARSSCRGSSRTRNSTPPRPAGMYATEMITDSVPDEGELEVEAPQAPVPWETLRDAADRVSDDIAHDVVTGRAECKR